MLLSELMDILSDIREECGDLEIIVEDEYGNEFELLPNEISADEQGQVCVFGIEFDIE